MTTEDLDRLETIAKAATPGKWEHESRYGTVQGGPVVSFARGSGRQQIVMAVGQEWMRPGEIQANAEHIAAFNPQTAQVLIEAARERDALRAQVAHALARDIERIFDRWLPAPPQPEEPR